MNSLFSELMKNAPNLLLDRSDHKLGLIDDEEDKILKSDIDFGESPFSSKASIYLESIQKITWLTMASVVTLRRIPWFAGSFIPQHKVLESSRKF